MEERLSKTEIRKDAMQEIVGSGASTVGDVASIITTAVKDVANAIGGFATDVFEIRDGARRASKQSSVEDETPGE
ncbi:hypothetical protein [Mycolicibacterium tusciae]|uniref:hypothetical protein n=1 Tax=Mycolicibacterium tusciae TaxID=75922 RepID=UPI00024A369E|nr:hypothetical protein [Mycolicibacterium tusciae]